VSEAPAARGTPARLPWWAAVLLLALAARLACLLGLREPLLYGDQYNYLFGGLRIAAHDDPLDYVLRSDEWRSWNMRWTRAPLYPILAALPFRVLGPRLLPLQLLNVLLGALSAVLVGALARRVSPRWGAWAGAAQALYWPAVDLAPKTLSENLHTPLLLGALLLLARSAEGSRRLAGLGGFVLGASALARTVSAAFVPIAALWRCGATGGRADLRAALLSCAGAAAAILPWTARNVIFTHQAVLIDSVGSFNLWKDNLYEDDRWNEGLSGRGPRPGEVRVRAGALVHRIASDPSSFAAKIADNAGHLLRLEGLHLLLDDELPQPAWRHTLDIVLDDAVLALALSLFLASLAAGPWPAARWLLLAWLAYYSVLLVAVFHVEIRYRSAFVPVLFAAAAAGPAALSRRAGPRASRRRLAVALALLPAGVIALAYCGPAGRALAAAIDLAEARAALARGERETAAHEVAAAAERDPGSARPWIVYGGMLSRAGDFDAALAAYDRVERAKPDHWVPPVVRPQLMRAAGRDAPELLRADRAVQLLVSRRGAWPALEIAWRELPPPAGEELELPRDEHGGARGVYHPKGSTRWTGRRAWLRLQPSAEAAWYDVALELASPPPAPDPAPTVEVRVSGGRSARFSLERAFRSYALRVPAAAARPLVVEIRAPVWLKVGLRAELGVAVRRMTVTPLR
jgi:4-amino-4-deoxy-L-arabinose transferase-like glycosyltransferase